MKVLWFTSTPSGYKSAGGAYNGCGWISSIERAMKNEKSIDLSVSFLLSGEAFKCTQDGVTYYPIQEPHTSLITRITHAFNTKTNFDIKDYHYYLSAFKMVIEDCNPEIIHIFGSENIFGLVATITNIPIVLHIQGILNPYYTAFLPPFVSWNKYFFSEKNPIEIFKKYRDKKNIEIGSNREKFILSKIKFYIGRTEWDYRISRIYNPQSKYFYGSEVLRDVFYEESIRVNPSNLKIITTISSPFYKGIDLIFKTATILQDICRIDFEWNIYGNVDWNIVCRTFNYNSQNSNLKFRGVASAEQLKESILSSTLYMHPSYIDNSPNSVCEAQILGCPVIATNVGGVSSLIQDSKTGYLVPSNDPYQTAFLIQRLYTDRELNERIGNASKNVAIRRHDKKTIIDGLVNIYNDIINS